MEGLMLDIIDEREIPVGQLAESVARYTGKRCTIGMINNYEKHGLILHSSCMKGGGRLFKIQDIQTVICIKRWQEEGLSLTHIKNKIAECPDKFYPEEIIQYLPKDTRALILKASAKIFPQKGYEATTIQDIAAEVNISSSMIYQFYKSKEDLFFAFMEAFTEDKSYKNILSIKDSLVKKQKLSYQDIHEALFNIALNFTHYHALNFEFVHLVDTTSRTFPEIGRYYTHNIIEPTEELLTLYLEHLKEQGFRFMIEPKLAVKFFYGAFGGMILTRNFLSGVDMPIIPDKAEILSIVEFFMRGMLEPPKLE
jgi:AcrR family transcriptional regulator